jgi:hypothetical protein
LQRLSTLLTHQSLAGFMLGCGTGLGCLLDHSRSQTIHLLIDRLLIPTTPPQQADGAK